MYFKDVRIANELEISRGNWEDMVKELNLKLKDVMAVPHLTQEHAVLRVCLKNKIDKVETDAMLKMV